MSNVEFLTLSGDVRKRLVSNTSTVDFLSLKVGATGLEIKEATGNFDFSAKVLTDVANAVANTDVPGWGQVKDYVAAAVVGGGTVKQALLTEIQLDDAQGILPGLVAFLTTNAVEDDTFVLKDAAGNTETFTFKTAPAGAFEVAVGVDSAASMSNLSAKINASSLYWKAWYDTTVLDSIYTTGLVGIYRKVVASSAFKVWVTGTVAGSVTDYHTSLEYKTNTSVLVALGNLEPATALSGFSIAKAALTNGEIHLVIAEDKLKSWNGDASGGVGAWFTMSEGVIPVASSGSGGAVLGKATYDSDKGVEITGIGIVKAKVDGSSTYFDGSGNIAIKSGGVSAVKLNADVAGAGIVLNGTSNALDINVDNSSVEIATDILQVKALGIATGMIAANAVTAAKLNADVAGAGLVLNGTSNALDINVDNSSVEIATDILQVKALGIATGMIAANAVTAAKLNADVAGAGLVLNGTSNALDINVDNSSVEIATDILQVKALGIATGMIAANAVTAAKLNADVAGAGLVLNGTSNALEINVGAELKIVSDQIVLDSAKSLTNDNAGAITIRQIVYIKANGNVDLAQATVAALYDFELGIVEDATIAAAAPGKIVVKHGAVVGSFSGLTPGKKLYVSRATAGAYTQSLAGFVAGEFVYSIGRAISATEVSFCPEFEFEY